MKKKAIEIVTNEPKTAQNDSLKIDSTSSISIKEEKVFFDVQQVDFDKLKIKSKITLNTEKIKQSIPATIHVKKDSVIWISIAIGLEAARANIDKDSIALLDRLNRNYYKMSFTQLSTRLGFDVNYHMLQSLLIGNLPIDKLEEDEYQVLSEYNTITQNRSGVIITNFFEKIKSKLYSISAKDNTRNTELRIDYKNFINENDQIVPSIINLMISAENQPKATIEFEHSKLDFLDRNIRFPFNIPKGYTKSEIPNF
ncbi:MAG: DUF4292 domain-containing protein [Cytophagaceae bacterium]|nr:DUF4292 domain-containing protein [Cytophagaceae bacterium]